MPFRFYLFSAALAASSLSCATSDAIQELIMQRAVFEMECANKQLSVVEIGNDTYGVTGCGKKAVYLITCGSSANISTCKAVLNSEKLRPR